MTDRDPAGTPAPRTPTRRPLLIETKMSLPPPPRRGVSRPALLERLRQGLERKLTVVVAPAGFGKTTLVAEGCRALRDEGHAVAWLSVDADDDLAQIGAYVIAALRGAAEPVGRRAAQLLADDPLAPAKLVLSVLLNDLAAFGSRVVLVLDDIDRVQSPAVHEALFRLLRHASDNLRVVLTGRAQPAVPLSYFLLREQLCTIDMEQLRFDAAQARDFFARAGGAALAPDDAQRLIDATEGWVAGLQLASLCLRDAQGPLPIAHSLARTGRGVDAYLGENVLPQVPAAVIDFLVATSVPERLTAPLAAALSGRTDAQDILDWLEARNLFIRPIDDSRTWYRLHALFRDYLLRRLERQGAAAVQSRHRAASAWFAEQALWPEAVRHALAAGDIAQAADWVEQCAMALVERSDAHTVLSWVAKLPPSALGGRVRLRLAHAWALAMMLRTGEVDAALRAVQADIAGAGLDLGEDLRREVLAVSGVVAALNDDSILALRLGTEIAALRPDEGSWVAEMGRTVLSYGLMYASRFDEVQRLESSAAFPVPGRPVHAQVYRRSVWGLAAWLSGDLREAARLFEQALAYAESTVGPLSAAATLPAGYLVSVAWEWNDLDRVARLLQGRLDVAKQTSSISSLTGMLLASARLASLRGDVDAAREVLEQGMALAAQRRWLRLSAALALEGVRLDLAEGRLAQAQRSVDALEAMLPGSPPAQRCALSEAWHAMRTARCRLQIARGQAPQAVAVLRDQAADWDAAHMPHRAARTRILLALACAAGGRAAEAQQALAVALAHGQQQGLVRSVVDEGEPARQLVMALQRGDFPELQAGYLHGLLAAFASPSTPAPAATEPTPASRLSAREVEILDFIAQGLSNKEIARALRVAPETIKWHLKNIYEKLNVSTRVQAVQCGLGVDLPMKGTRTGE
ncbi:MAG TPA: LuxR C-terminal-related transcriptional regulator [Albitalea sp.]|uniref:LuxR C-terminal-related transcriptional regulator n=1 Tax=Piscinibacter sp. TaxID=1903157 RepID=UPI002ED3D610